MWVWQWQYWKWQYPISTSVLFCDGEMCQKAPWSLLFCHLSILCILGDPKYQCFEWHLLIFSEVLVVKRDFFSMVKHLCKVEVYPDMDVVSGWGVLSRRAETELKLRRSDEFWILQPWVWVLYCSACARLEEKNAAEEDVEGRGEPGVVVEGMWVGKKAPWANLVTSFCTVLLKYLRLCLMSFY